MLKHTHPTIELKSYRFNFIIETKVHLPKFAGSAWRGAFGTALKKTVCVVRSTPCGECMLRNSCAYSYIFETPPPENTEKMRKYTAAPHPFVLRLIPESMQNVQEYAIDLHLFGHAERFFPYVVYAFQQAGLNGIGGHRQAFHLQNVVEMSPTSDPKIIFQHGKLSHSTSAKSPELPAIPKHITLKFQTPLRLKQAGKNLSDSHFNFGSFFNTLLRRISLLTYFHTDNPLDIDFKYLTAKARTIEFSTQQLTWYDWTRYSSRQQTEMQMGGLIGSASLSMQGLEEFWPYLWLGQWTHLGKGTSMGLGEYSIEMTSLPNQD